ncbi:MAG TPA: DUF58 domain-containing protein [Planctomycetota bacterium]|nr:DUF58 domain-containing protein [Planctomycetota bacterium]
MRVRPTTLGTKGLLLLGALEFTFLASGYRNLFFLLIAFCCSLGGLCLVWSVANLRRLAARLHEPPFAPADTPRPLRLELHCRKARVDLAVELRVRGEWTEIAYAPTATGTIELDAKFPGLPRGVHEVQGMRVLTRFPFGFFRARLDLPVSATLVTFPNPDAADRDELGLDHHSSSHMAHAGQRSPSVAGLREFRTGDALADVHWKASARRGTPIVKEREIESGTGIEVAIDRRCAPEALESALAIATSVLLDRRHDERRLHLRSQDCALEVGPRRNGEAQALRWLAAATLLPPSAPPVPSTSAACLWLPARTAGGS